MCIGLTDRPEPEVTSFQRDDLGAVGVVLARHWLAVRASLAHDLGHDLEHCTDEFEDLPQPSPTEQRRLDNARLGAR